MNHLFRTKLNDPNGSDYSFGVPGSGAKIARQLNISRNTIGHYIQRFKATTYTWEQLLEMEDAALCELAYAPEDPPIKDERRRSFEERANYFLVELKGTGVTRHLLWQEYRQQYPDGYGYSQFCDLLTRHSSVTDTSMHFEHPPGHRYDTAMGTAQQHQLTGSSGRQA